MRIFEGPTVQPLQRLHGRTRFAMRNLSRVLLTGRKLLSMVEVVVLIAGLQQR